MEVSDLYQSGLPRFFMVLFGPLARAMDVMLNYTMTASLHIFSNALFTVV
jgi:hypothetical protein